MAFAAIRVGALGARAKRFANRVVLAVSDEASTAISRIEPVVSPLLVRVASRISLGPIIMERGRAWVNLEEFLRRTALGQSVPSGPGAAPPEPGEGVQHLTQLVEQRLGQLHRMKRFDKTSDPIEAVHQLRVASRRLRAFVDTFEMLVEPELVRAARRQLRHVTRAVRDLRDADVQSQALEVRLSKATSEPERMALNHLLHRTRLRRRELAKRAHQELSKADSAALARPLRQMLDQIALRARSPSATYELIAKIAFEPVWEAAREANPVGSAQPTPEALHKFRLAMKKLRYAAELVEPALGARFGEIHETAKRLQTLLGDHQDSVVFEKLVEKRHQKALRGGRPSLASGLGLVLEQAKQERRLLRERSIQACVGWSQPRLVGADPAPQSAPTG